MAAETRGEKLYAEKCLMCHQASGQGAPPLFPPLAGSEWFTLDRKRVIKAVCEGLSGKITVAGQTYDNAMPAQILDDAQVADVLTYVGASWGNRAPAFTADEVAAVRATTRFKTFDALVKAAGYPPLPTAPPGWSVREVVQLPDFMVRMTGDRVGKVVYLLGQNGDVHSLDPATGALAKIIRATDYLDANRGDFVTLGCTLDAGGKLWITSNQKLTKDVPVYTNEVTIWRTSESVDGHPAKPVRWFTDHYPYGFGSFNHGISHIAFGPDGLLYASSGARTDGGEIRGDERYAQVHEVDNTACLWRLDPKSETPQREVIARGIRNSYSFAWDGDGNLFSFSNGPDYDAGEEMDFIVPGRHYGFPYQFEDWPVKPAFPYPHTPAPPPGLSFTFPVENIGPDGGFTPGKIARTFTPHSSPGGTIWCGEDFAPPLRGSFLMTRYGNLLAKPEDSGFDVLRVRPRRRGDGTWEVEVHTVLAPLGRPLDAHALPGGKALILEYTRPTNFKDGLGWLPGRIIELAPAAQP